MFFIILIICFHFLLFNTQNDFCVVPFGEDRCMTYLKPNQMHCKLNPLNTYRQSICVEYQNHSFILILTDFTLFYPPYINILFNLMKNDEIVYGFAITVDDFTLELDLNPFVNLIQPDYLYLFILSAQRMKKLNLIFNSPLYINLTVDKWEDDFFSLNFDMISSKKNEKLCYNFQLNSRDNETHINEINITCPSNKCLIHENETRSCLGSIPCSPTGSNSLLCQIDRLRSNDEFNSKTSFEYTDLIITTSDNQKQTRHQFSASLFNSCIIRRLTIVIIYGRLEIPSLNTILSSPCPDSFSTRVEFWHGNCSTFEILYNNDLERMREKNLITFGNFYTGQQDKLTITCVVYLSKQNTNGRFILSTRFWIILSIIMFIIFISILWYYKKSFQRYFIQICRRNLNTTNNLKDSSSTFK